MGKSKSKILYLLAGAPGSGKSTWVHNHIGYVDPRSRIVSRDAIRFMLLRDGDDYFSKEDEVWKTFVDKIKYFLNSYDVMTVFADATHLNEKSRSKLLYALGDSLKDVEVNVIVMDTPLAVCLERNEQREGIKKVPRGQIRRMFYSFTMPTLDEGFDNIITYTKVGDRVKYTIERKDPNESGMDNI